MQRKSAQNTDEEQMPGGLQCLAELQQRALPTRLTMSKEQLVTETVKLPTKKTIVPDCAASCAVTLQGQTMNPRDGGNFVISQKVGISSCSYNMLVALV